jgi:hypothetical protein
VAINRYENSIEMPKILKMSAKKTQICITIKQAINARTKIANWR